MKCGSHPLTFLISAPIVFGAVHFALACGAFAVQLETYGTDGDSGPTWVRSALLFPVSMLPADWILEHMSWMLIPINSLAVGGLITALIVCVDRIRLASGTRAPGGPA